MTDSQPFGGNIKPRLPYHPLPRMDEYLTELEANGRTKDYIRQIKIAFSHFADWARVEGIQIPDDITRTQIIKYQAHLGQVEKGDGTFYTSAYKQQQLKYLRGWVLWMAELGFIQSDPWVKIKIGTTPKKPKPLEDDEVAALFAAHRQQAFSIDPFMFHRRETILTLLYSWGLRIHELQGLNVTNMDMRLEWVMAKNKGGGTKSLPYGQKLKIIVQRWLVHRAKYAKVGEDALLIDQNGNRLSLNMIRKIVTDCGNRASITINPHRLRDTFATTMLDHDVEVERLMKMMGHSQRSQTLAYARVNDHKVKESHDRIMGPILDELLD